MVGNKYFDITILLLIIANTVALAAEHFGQPFWLFDTLTTINVVLTILFTLELVLKVVGLGATEYMRDSWNTFDATVVLFSLLELMLQSSGAVSALRSFRLLRIFRLARGLRSAAPHALILCEALTAVPSVPHCRPGPGSRSTVSSPRSAAR